MRIVFLGTPDFAVASLKALMEHQFDVVAVVTAPDKPAGRGMKLQQSAVKTYALSQNIPVLQPEKLKSEQFIQELASYKADIHVVVAFRMLPEVVWNMPPLGTINVHASLLPNYRGAAPINWAIINGESETGVTTFKLKHQIDTGDILMQAKVMIEDDDNAGSLHDKLMEIGAKLLISTLNELHTGSLKESPQVVSEEHRHAPKIYTQTCEINWNKNAIELQNLIRGLSPYPAAFTSINGKKVKLFKTTFSIETPSLNPGEYDCDQKKKLKFACLDGYIHVDELQMEGKTRMTIEDFLRGNKL